MPVPSHFCLRCGKYHLMRYVLDTKAHRHLVVECPKSEYAIAMQHGLNIPTVESKRKIKADALTRQPQLL